MLHILRFACVLAAGLYLTLSGARAESKPNCFDDINAYRHNRENLLIPVGPVPFLHTTGDFRLPLALKDTETKALVQENGQYTWQYTSQETIADNEDDYQGLLRFMDKAGAVLVLLRTDYGAEGRLFYTASTCYTTGPFRLEQQDLPPGRNGQAGGPLWQHGTLAASPPLPDAFAACGKSLQKGWTANVLMLDPVPRSTENGPELTFRFPQTGPLFTSLTPDEFNRLATLNGNDLVWTLLRPPTRKEKRDIPGAAAMWAIVRKPAGSTACRPVSTNLRWLGEEDVRKLPAPLPEVLKH